MALYSVISLSTWLPLKGAVEHWILANDDFEINGSFVPSKDGSISEDSIICIVAQKVEKDVAIKLKDYLMHQRIDCTVVRSSILGPFVGWIKLLPFVLQLSLVPLLGLWLYFVATGPNTYRSIITFLVPVLIMIVLVVLRRFPTILFPVRSAY